MTLTIDVAMLGPSGAGKTSLLVSMYAQFPEVTKTTGLVLSAQDPKTSAELNLYRADLDRLGRRIVVRESGIANTELFRQHTFSLRDQGHENGSHIDICFSDYPGGLLSDPAQTADPRLLKALDDSDILVLAIDTPAMLAEDGRWHHEVNSPQLIRDVVTRWLDKPRRLLLLVPLKCEKWTPTEEAALRLAEQVRTEYHQLLDIVTASVNLPQVSIAPVQTVGSVVFDCYQVQNGVAIGRYRGKPKGRYDPKWTAEPVRIILQNALRRQQAERSGWTKFTDYLFGDGHHLREAIETLAGMHLGPNLSVK